MTPEAQTVLAVIHGAECPLSAREVYKRTYILEKEQQAYHYCHWLAKNGYIEAVCSDPKRYQITAAGRKALESEDTQGAAPQALKEQTDRGRGAPNPGITDEDLKKPEEKASQTPVNYPSIKRGLAAFLDRRLDILPQPLEVDAIVEVFEDLIDTLERHAPQYADDIRLLKTGCHILRRLQQTTEEEAS